MMTSVLFVTLVTVVPAHFSSLTSSTYVVLCCFLTVLENISTPQDEIQKIEERLKEVVTGLQGLEFLFVGAKYLFFCILKDDFMIFIQFYFFLPSVSHS